MEKGPGVAKADEGKGEGKKRIGAIVVSTFVYLLFFLAGAGGS
jgi:hypothetical protein